LMISQWSAGGAGFQIDFTGSTTSLNCIVLPIELLNFSATPQSNSILTTWSTASETGNDFFTLERSYNTFDYVTAGTVKGAGNSTTPISYSFEDREPAPGIIYYRLKQTDLNGAFSYSAPVAVRFSPVKGSMYLVPNPASGQTNLVYNSVDKSRTQIKIMDMKGFGVYRGEVMADAGVNTFPLDLQKLDPGIFVVVLMNDRETIELRLEKQ